jgi:hypothetical protein
MEIMLWTLPHTIIAVYIDTGPNQNLMSCSDIIKYLIQTFMSYGNKMICQQGTLSGYAEWPKVANAMIKAVIAMAR